MAIKTQIDRIKSAKESIKQALIDKGVAVGDERLDEYGALVEGISSGGNTEQLDSVAYYKKNRNKNYPYFPLPSEMDETQDTIYMLYDASSYMCCPVFNITFTECVCTIQKYMNKTLISEYVESVTSGTIKYLQFSEEDSDYLTYNYIVIKLQGNITAHNLNYQPKFNNVTYDKLSSGDLIEVSGKAPQCAMSVVRNVINNAYHQNLEYYSFLGTPPSNLNGMFYNCFSLKAVVEFETKNFTYAGSMFLGCRSLETIPQMDTSKVTNMSRMFYQCSSLKNIPQMDTSQVTDMSEMFYYCSSLKNIPQMDTSKVTNMSKIFYQCNSLKNIPQMDTSQATNMSEMFYDCYSLKTIPQLDTSQATNMSSMFHDCYSLKTIPQLDTSSATNIVKMFYNCYSLETIPQLDTSQAQTLISFCYYCNSLKTIQQLDANNATSLTSVFAGNYLLQKIKIINVKFSFDLSSAKMLLKESIIEVLNDLPTVTTTQKLTLGSTNLAKLTDDEKAIATNKGWTLA